MKQIKRQFKAHLLNPPKPNKLTFVGRINRPVTVFLDGAYIGEIHKVQEGYQYVAKGKSDGEIFQTIQKCKDAIRSANETNQ